MITSQHRSTSSEKPSIVDGVLALVLSVGVVALVSGAIDSGFGTGGAVASILALSMTAPVLVRRQWPLLAALIIAIGAWVNGPAFDNVVRCGAALPALFLIAFSCGLRLPRAKALQGLALCVVAVAGQAIFDPVLGAPAMIMLVPLSAASWGVGRLVMRRSADTSELAIRNAALREQREENARLAVAADREAVAMDLDVFLHDQIGDIAAKAAMGTDALETNPTAARDALADIEKSGRSTLNRMRSVVGSLKDDANGPQPVLAQLSELVARVAASDARLEIHGDPRELPAGIELSGYRIVEHLLTAMSSDQKADVKVSVTFGADALELDISGAMRRNDPTHAIAAAKERVAIHGGSLTTRNSRGRANVHARLPLATNG